MKGKICHTLSMVFGKSIEHTILAKRSNLRYNLDGASYKDAMERLLEVLNLLKTLRHVSKE